MANRTKRLVGAVVGAIILAAVIIPFLGSTGMMPRAAEAVTAKISEGSMGEVYRVWDTTLDWEVALKVLPDRRLRHEENRSGANVELEKDGDTVPKGPVSSWGSCLYS